MLCDICGKNPATVHLTEIIDESMNELHLCEECARQKSAQMESQFGLSDLLAGMADFEKPAKEAEAAAMKCPSCGLTYAEFKKIGRLGCGGCYNAFSKYLAPLLRRIHGSSHHIGKTPLKISAAAAAPMPASVPISAAPGPGRITKKKLSLEELRAKLQKAVEAEAFEEAAKLRDQIKELEKKSNEA